MSTPPSAIAVPLHLPRKAFTRVLAELRACIPGEPVSKGRPRFGKGRTYTPDKTVKYEEHVRAHLLAGRLKAKGWPAGGWFRPEVTYAVEIELIVESIRGDVDNKAKGILDAANKLLWPDDTRVTCVLITRRHAVTGERPCAMVRVLAITASEKTSEELARKPKARAAAALPTLLARAKKRPR